MSAIYMRRSPTADAPTAGGWTLIDQTDALVDDAEIATATSELKQEIGLPDSMEGEERENVEADAVINRGAALARDPRVQRSVLESLVAAQPVAAAPAFPDEAARLRREVEELKRELGRVLQERTNTTPETPEPSLGVASLLITRCLERRRERGEERECPSLRACLAVPGAVVHCLAPGPGGRLVDCLATEPPTMVRDVRA
jgi:hypothetical protein